jgi:hypothetical protein
MPVIPALGRLRQEDPEFETSMGYIAKPCQKKRNLNKRIFFLPCCGIWGKEYILLQKLVSLPD